MAEVHQDHYDPSWLAPVLVSATTKELLTSHAAYAEAFFTVEAKRLRRFYTNSGNPRLTYLCGQGISKLGLDLAISGCLGLGVLEIMLAELLIASGGSARDLAQAAEHLGLARNQIEKSSRMELVPRLFGQWYMMMAVAFKARRKLDDYENVLQLGTEDSWIQEHGSPGDIIPVLRQRVMMRQDLKEHIVLLYNSASYKSTHPIEYYRTLKRVIEFFTNHGLSESAAELEREFILAYAQCGDKHPTIGKVSFGRDMAQLAALKGDNIEAKKLVRLTLAQAKSAELFGQVRQLKILSDAIDDGDVRGALEQFRV